MTEPVKNPLLDAIRNSANAPKDTPPPTTTVVEPEVAPLVAVPGKGEVLFEPSSEHVLVRTALPNGREVGFPYIAKDAEDIKFLHAFADHCGLLTITEGQ